MVTQNSPLLLLKNHLPTLSFLTFIQNKRPREKNLSSLLPETNLSKKRHKLSSPFLCSTKKNCLPSLQSSVLPSACLFFLITAPPSLLSFTNNPPLFSYSLVTRDSKETSRLTPLFSKQKRPSTDHPFFSFPFF